MSGGIEANRRVTFGVRYEDSDVVVIEKPAGLVSTPGKGHERDTLLNGLFASFGTRLQRLGATRDFGMLQRLDRDASGLVVVALTIDAWDGLREAFAQRRVGKYYWAVTRRAPAQPAGLIRKPLEERNAPRKDRWQDDPRRRRFDRVKLAVVSARGKPAATAFRTLGVAEGGALLECRALTGRLHQVRVHLDSIGCSILGDRFYGPEAARRSVGRLLLHAHRLTFDHPATGEPVEVRARCPRDMRRTLQRLGIPTPGTFSPAAGSPAAGSPADGGHQLGGDAVGQEDPAVGQDPPAG
ncbi:MAG: RluA family pseudouridine synthase [Planctomycetota bacterium]